MALQLALTTLESLASTTPCPHAGFNDIKILEAGSLLSNLTHIYVVPTPSLIDHVEAGSLSNLRNLHVLVFSHNNIRALNGSMFPPLRVSQQQSSFQPPTISLCWKI